MFREAMLVMRKDLLIERRSLASTAHVIPFALVMLVLFAFALDPDRATLDKAAPGLFWIAVLLSALMAIQRSFAIESGGSAFEFLKMSGLGPTAVFLGKAAALGVQLLVLECILLVGVVVLYNVDVSAAVDMIPVCLLTTVGIAAVGTIYGSFSGATSAREALLPLMFLPVIAPVLLAATRASEAAIGIGLDYGVWMQVLAVFAVVYLAAGSVAFGPLMEDA